MMLRGLFSILCIVAATSTTEGPGPDVLAPPSGARLVGVPDGSRPTLRPPRSLPFFYDLYTFRTDGGGTTVVAAIAVQVRRLRGERRNRQTQYRFDLRFVVADTASHAVFPSIDSVFVSSPHPLPGQHLLHTYVEVQAPPSDATLQRVVVTDAARAGVGQLYTTPFPVPDYSGSELMLSDIAFGLPDSESGWTRRGITLALLPTSQFPESSFDVFYEIYNLPSGNPYDTEIAIEPLDESDSEERIVRALFSGESQALEDGTLAELRRVQSALPKGRYRLTVTVRDKTSGESAARSRMVEVRGWERGTTMVTALPRGRWSRGR